MRNVGEKPVVSRSGGKVIDAKKGLDLRRQV